MRRASVGAALVVVLLSGCSQTQAPERTDPAPTSTLTASPSSAPTKDDGTRTLGDYEVRLIDVQPDADVTIAKANLFNKPPRFRYAMLTYSATYLGAEAKGQVVADLMWTMEGGDGRTYQPAGVITPGDRESQLAEIPHGSPVTLHVAFDAPAAAVEGGTFVVTGYDEQYDEVSLRFSP